MEIEEFSIKTPVILLLLTLVPTWPALAQTEVVLYSFGGGGAADAHSPYVGMVWDSLGNLYGTTNAGGAFGYGAVFELTPSAGGWTESVLYSFTGNADGAEPNSLALDVSGNIYGTTHLAGLYLEGTVFELRHGSDGSWTLDTLHNFKNDNKDGMAPSAGVVFDAGGNLYGTTNQGGVYRAGIVYELTRTAGGSWAERIPHNFAAGSDGANPVAGLILDNAGNLYGTTASGGVYANGIAFELTRRQGGVWSEKILHTFKRGNDAALPQAGLSLDAAGNLYGTTDQGGANGFGTVFELIPPTPTSTQWTEKILHSFVRNLTDGQYPYAGVTLDSSGNLYGTCSAGGANQVGVVFELIPGSDGSWTENILHSFSPNPDGAQPTGGVIFDSAGNLFGTTFQGGAFKEGTVYEITP